MRVLEQILFDFLFEDVGIQITLELFNHLVQGQRRDGISTVDPNMSECGYQTQTKVG
jgi:hypothetical protein